MDPNSARITLYPYLFRIELFGDVVIRFMISYIERNSNNASLVAGIV